MPDSLRESWSSNPNAPEVPLRVYFDEKANLVGALTSTMLYGIVILLFFRCMGALVSPVNRTAKGIKWLLVPNTVSMFSFATVLTAVNLAILSDSYIGNRKFAFTNNSLPTGPLGHKYHAYSKPIGVAPALSFLMNNWLADGLLLYRCYVMYSMRYSVIALPCLLFLAALATGILLIYEQATKESCTIWHANGISLSTQYSISVSLNVLLTGMIVTRLFLLRRDVRKAMNAPVRIGGMYRAVIAMLSDSCALYSVNFLLYVGTWAAKSPVQYVFFLALGQVQVIAVFLITLRVSNRRKSASDETVTGDLDSTSLSFENTTEGGPPPGRLPTGAANTGGNTSAELNKVAAASVMTETTRSLSDL